MRGDVKCGSGSCFALCGRVLLHALAIGMVATAIAIAHSWISPIELYWQPTVHITPSHARDQATPAQPAQADPRTQPRNDDPLGRAPDPLGDPPTPIDEPASRPVVIQPDKLGPFITLAEGKAIFDLGLYPWVDARLRSQYEEERILAAYHLHSGGLNTPEGAQTLFDLMAFKDDHIILYCDSPTCDAAENLARELQKIGFHKLHIMHEGIQGWKAAGYPTEKGPVR